jgi:predicted MPP superfamily phosphohydrolase
MILRWLLFIAFIFFLSWYASQALKTVFKNVWFQYGFYILNFIIVTNFIFQIYLLESNGKVASFFSYSLGLFLIIVVFQILIIFFILFEDLFRIPQWFYHIFSKGISQSFKFIPERRLFISQLAILLASIPASALFIGMLRGKYSYRVINHELSFDKLPSEFTDFRIAHVSDFHCGSFDNEEKLAYGISMINQQHPDIILFTGDMVNNIAKEILPWKKLISSLNAPYGKYAVLGNHDYGDYVKWDSEEEKKANLKQLIFLLEDMGFKVLLNNAIKIDKKNSSISLIGVENWGSGKFKKNGDLDLALKKVPSEDFKILMSHDPSHWEEQVISHKEHIDLTLSGHTHGMQFGIEIPGWIKWSPIQYRYKYWAGVYKEQNQFINVNRGFGFLAYPGRVGIYPEISILDLKSKLNDDNSTV